MDWKNILIILAMLLMVFSSSARCDQENETVIESNITKQGKLIESIENPYIPLPRHYETYDSKVYAGAWFWMNNHKIIFSTEEKKPAHGNFLFGLTETLGPLAKRDYARAQSVIKTWDLNNGSVTTYRNGRLWCYDNGIINFIVLKSHEPFVYDRMSGKLGKESKASYWPNFPEVCNDSPDEITKTYQETHPDEFIFPLLNKDGFIVMGKRDHGTRGALIQRDYVTYHPVNAAPIRISIPNVHWSTTYLYFKFAKVYELFVARPSADPIAPHSSYMEMLFNGELLRVKEHYLIFKNGEVAEIEEPRSLSNKGIIAQPYLTAVGVLWTQAAMSKGSPGMFLSHGDKMINVSTDNTGTPYGKVSPDGCRFAYLHVGINQTDRQGSLKVIDLCKGDK